MGDGLMVEVPRKSIVTDSAVGWKLLEDSPKIHGFLAGELAISRERQHHPPPTTVHWSSPLGCPRTTTDLSNCHVELSSICKRSIRSPRNDDSSK